jgi:hypothetical protein
MQSEGRTGTEGGGDIRAVCDDDAVPGTVDFGRGEKEQAENPMVVEGTPSTRYWLIPTAIRAKMFTLHPLMS